MAVQQLHNGNSDGVSVGQGSSDKVGFYGETPVVQASAITTLTTTPTATDIATAVNAIIVALQNIGITA